MGKILKRQNDKAHARPNLHTNRTARMENERPPKQLNDNEEETECDMEDTVACVFFPSFPCTLPFCNDRPGDKAFTPRTQTPTHMYTHRHHKPFTTTPPPPPPRRAWHGPQTLLPCAETPRHPSHPPPATHPTAVLPPSDPPPKSGTSLWHALHSSTPMGRKDPGAPASGPPRTFGKSVPRRGRRQNPM